MLSYNDQPICVAWLTYENSQKSRSVCGGKLQVPRQDLLLQNRKRKNTLLFTKDLVVNYFIKIFF